MNGYARCLNVLFLLATLRDAFASKPCGSFYFPTLKSDSVIVAKEGETITLPFGVTFQNCQPPRDFYLKVLRRNNVDTQRTLYCRLYQEGDHCDNHTQTQCTCGTEKWTYQLVHTANRSDNPPVTWTWYGRDWLLSEPFVQENITFFVTSAEEVTGVNYTVIVIAIAVAVTVVIIVGFITVIVGISIKKGSTSDDLQLVRRDEESANQQPALPDDVGISRIPVSPDHIPMAAIRPIRNGRAAREEPDGYRYPLPTQPSKTPATTAPQARYPLSALRPPGVGQSSRPGQSSETIQRSAQDTHPCELIYDDCSSISLP